MRNSILCRALGFVSVASVTLLARNAGATNITEFPDNGSEQMGRGGAWVARASDPLAAFYNPAGLAGQETRATVQANINIQKTCFTRLKAANDATTDTVNGQRIGPGQTFPQVCSGGEPFPNPQLGFTYRLADRVGLGIAVLGPSASGNQNWPSDATAASRYLLIKGNAVLLTPTLGVGVEVVDGLRLGASFQWGIADLKFTTRSPALNTGSVDAQGRVTGGQGPSNDIDATLHAKQMFIPGFTIGAMYTPAPNIDLAGWFRWSAPIKAKGDVTTIDSAQKSNKPGDTSLSDCGGGAGYAGVCGSGDNASIRVPIPMEAKLGVRFHQPRGEQKAHLRDPMSQDAFDVELDLTYANNKAFDAIQVRFPGDSEGNGIIPVPAALGGTLPPNADIVHKYKDVVGIRLGGDYNVIPDRLAVRVGGYFETNGQDAQYQNIDFAGAQRIGFALGGTYRLHLGAETSRALEVSLGVGHTFVADQTNNGPNGLLGLAGTACNPTEQPKPPAGDFCSTGAQKYRTNWPVNLGTITNSFTAINIGLSYRF